MSNVIIAGFARRTHKQRGLYRLAENEKRRTILSWGTAVVARDAAGEIPSRVPTTRFGPDWGRLSWPGTLLAVSGVGLVLVGIGAVGSGMLVDKGLHPDISFDFSQ